MFTYMLAKIYVYLVLCLWKLGNTYLCNDMYLHTQMYQLQFVYKKIASKFDIYLCTFLINNLFKNVESVIQFIWYLCC